MTKKKMQESLDYYILTNQQLESDLAKAKKSSYNINVERNKLLHKVRALECELNGVYGTSDLFNFKYKKLQKNIKNIKKLINGLQNINIIIQKGVLNDD